VQYKNISAMMFNEVKCHVKTSLGLCPRPGGQPTARGPHPDRSPFTKL